MRMWRLDTMGWPVQVRVDPPNVNGARRLDESGRLIDLRVPTHVSSEEDAWAGAIRSANANLKAAEASLGASRESLRLAVAKYKKAVLNRKMLLESNEGRAGEGQ